MYLTFEFANIGLCFWPACLSSDPFLTAELPWPKFYALSLFSGNHFTKISYYGYYCD